MDDIKECDCAILSPEGSLKIRLALARGRTSIIEFEDDNLDDGHIKVFEKETHDG